jgi:two-component system sensor histidine kinase BarA
MSTAARSSLDELTLGQGARLDELVDRESLESLSRSLSDVGGVGLRVFGADGRLLADAPQPLSLVSYLMTLRGTRNALEKVVASVKSLEPEDGQQAVEPCVSGGLYRVVVIEHDARRVGKVVLGPYYPPSLRDIPTLLLELEPELDLDRARSLLTVAPRVTDESVERLGRHICATLEVLMFSGLKALLTSSMHLASVRESFRELEEKQHKLQTAYDRLKELDRLKSNFLATVSHELRTPLTSIIGYSEMLLEGIAGDIVGDQREFVTTIREKGEQLLGLIKGLLDLSKLESGTMSLRRAPMEVPALVRDVAQTMAPHAKKKGLTIEVRLETPLPELFADAERLRQVLLNLVENAVKFTPTGGTVRLEARMDNVEFGSSDGEGAVLMRARRPVVEFRVADTGIGIPEAERTRIFDAFYQVDSSSTREQGGTGLGLSIVKRLVESHDGRIHVEENQPNGAVFVVVIPVRRASFSS